MIIALGQKILDMACMEAATWPNNVKVAVNLSPVQFKDPSLVLHIASALNDLLDLSKVETGQFDLAFADVDLNAVIQQCVSIMQPQASRARIIIRMSLAPELGEVISTLGGPLAAVVPLLP